MKQLLRCPLVFSSYVFRFLVSLGVLDLLSLCQSIVSHCQEHDLSKGTWLLCCHETQILFHF